MPYVMNPHKLWVKDPERNAYLPQNVIAVQTAEEQVALVEAAGAPTIAAVQQAVADAQAAVNSLESQKNTIAQSIASMAQLSTDTTLSTPGMAADAGATGELKSAMNATQLRPINIIADSEYEYNTYYANTVGSSTINDLRTTTSGNRTYGVYECSDGDVIHFTGRNVNTHYLYDGDGILRKYDTSSGKTSITCSVDGYTIKYWAIVDTAEQGSIKAYTVPAEVTDADEISLYISMVQNGVYQANEFYNTLNNMVRNRALQAFRPDITSTNYATILPDLNGAKVNRIYNINGCLQSISHIPDTSDESGTLIVWNADYTRTDNLSFTVQMLVCSDNSIHVRSCWGNTWKDWYSAIDHIEETEDKIEEIEKKYVKSVLPDVTSSNYSSQMTDLNNVTMNTIRNINGCLQSIANIPSTNATSCTLICFNGDYSRTTKTSKAFTVQILATSNGEVWQRSCWGGTWVAWGKLYDLVTQGFVPNLANFSAIPKFGIIGDSLSVGAHTNKDGVTVNDENSSWGKYIGNQCNNTPLFLGFGGATTTLWIESTRTGKGLRDALLPEYKCDAYIIGLGYNDANSSSTSGGVILGSQSDIDTENEDNNAVSFYGNLDKILRKLHGVNPGSPLFVLTNPYYNVSDVPNYNEAVRYVCNRLGTTNNVHLIDLYALYGHIYTALASDREWNHYHKQTYFYMGALIGTAISNYMLANPTLFKYVGEY